MNCLAPSILAADFGHLADAVAAVDDAGAQYLHFDVMDGNFVPNISFGLPVLESVRELTERVLDVHMMVERPERFIDDYAKAGADIITVHAEATKHLDQCISHIKSKDVMAGVALNPATPLSQIEYILPSVDMVLLMSVNPGYGGQKFISYTLDKLEELSKMLEKKGLKTDVEVDGGVYVENTPEILAAGANILVAGSAVFNGDIGENVRKFLEVM